MLGKGIGYGKKPNEEIRVNEKDCQFFIPVTHNKSKQIIELLNSIPPEIFELTHEVIVLAKKELAIELNDSLYFYSGRSSQFCDRTVSGKILF